MILRCFHCKTDDKSPNLCSQLDFVCSFLFNFFCIIFFEISAQVLLTKNLFLFKKDLKKYINPLILKTKIIFVTMVFFITCAAFIILIFGDPSTAFKHILEWNYFTFLLLFYLLSALFWKKDKT